MAQTQPFIYKVHKHLRELNEKAYEPEIVAIGPYHRGKDNLKVMEEHKLRYLNALLDRKPHVKVENCMSVVAKIEQQARNCYAEATCHISSAEFIKMLVRDGCFIIELVLKWNNEDSTCKDNDPIFQTLWITTSLQRDLMLFENQIPFFVLCKLFDLFKFPGGHGKLNNMILSFFHSLFPEIGHQSKKDMSGSGLKHLLDLIHNDYFPLDTDSVFISVEPNGRSKPFLSIPSAIELTNANVRFRKNMKCGSLFDIVVFQKGILLLPPLRIRDRTECFFRNLIVYEQYFPKNQHTLVTDYARLLDCLINSSRDVELLSRRGIIDNWLGDDEEVARIFNRLTHTVTGATQFFYEGIFDDINVHYKKPWNKAMAVLKRDYINSPWACISFFAALLLLLLTVAQTLFSAQLWFNH